MSEPRTEPRATPTSAPPADVRRAEVAANLRQAAPLLGLIGVLLLAVLVPPDAVGGWLRLASLDRTRAAGMTAAFDALPDQALVLVAFDPDLGTYAEIRPVVRSALQDLLGRGDRLAFVSFTAEGRALAVAELARLVRLGGEAGVPADLGFAGAAEAGMIRTIDNIVPAAGSGPLFEAIRARGGGLDAFDLVLAVSGGDLSARTWVEQIQPRVPDLPLAAIAPTFLEPELAPYLRSGQLRALLATLPEGLAYASGIPVPDAGRNASVGPLPMLLGLLAALGVMLEALIAPLARRRRPRPRRRA